MRPAASRKRSLRLMMLAGAMMLVLCGCAGVSVRTHAYLGTPRYGPTPAPAVQILPAEPSRPKERLGEIILNVSGNPSRDVLENKLRNAAANLGADAVFIASDKTRIYPVVYYDWCYPPWIYQQSTRTIIAVAIKLT
jgi:hypothetical protein